MKVWVRVRERRYWANEMNMSWGIVYGLYISACAHASQRLSYCRDSNHHRHTVAAALMLFTFTSTSYRLLVGIRHMMLMMSEYIFIFYCQILTDSFDWNAIDEFVIEHELACVHCAASTAPMTVAQFTNRRTRARTIRLFMNKIRILFELWWSQFLLSMPRAVESANCTNSGTPSRA